MEKKIFLGLLLTLVIVVFIPVYWIGEPARQEKALHRQREQAMERGAETYVALCTNCHGPQGQGLIGSPLKGSKLSKEVMVKVITRGQVTNQVPMPAWGTEDGGPLKKHQIDELVLFMQNWDDHILEKAAIKHEEAVPLPQEPIALGRQLLATVGCSDCHGGGAEGTNFAPPLAGLNREQIVKQVRQPRTPLMPAYTPQHISDDHLEKIVGFLLTLKAPPPTPPPIPTGIPAAEAQQIAQGTQVYASLGCGACHGPAGKGTAIGPSIVGKSREEIIKQVRTPKGTMPPYPASALNDANLDKVVAFVVSLGKAEAAPPPPSPTPAPTPVPTIAPSPTPSPTAPDPQAIAQGTQVYVSLGCGACHGPSGKGTAIGPSIVGKSREEIIKQVRTPKGTMPPYPASALNDANLDKVVAYIQSLKP